VNSPGPGDAPSRGGLVESVLHPDTLAAVAKDQAQFARFCDRVRLPVGTDALTLYLTWLVDEGASGRAIRQRLMRLDLAARLDGRQPWTHITTVRLFLRGLYREFPIGGANQVSDPLYLELVQVLVAAVMAPTEVQLRDRAILLLAVEGGISGRALSQITWRNIRWVKGGVEITLPGEPKLHHPRLGSVVCIRERRGAACPVDALRRLREVGGVGRGLAPAEGGGILSSIPRIYEPLHHLEASDGDLAAALQKVSVSPKQFRDRAVLLLGYGAALRTREATRLRRRDVSITPEGLLVRIAGRDNPVGLPIDPGMPGDPVHAWEAWINTLEEQGQRSEDAPAFPRITGTNVDPHPMTKDTLNPLVQRAVERAGLFGTYTYSSLRTGFIRTAIRRDAQAHLIASHVDLHSLRSVGTHELRENILRTSVAGQLGL
jgi:integrase